MKYTPTQQRYKDEQKKSRRAKELAAGEKHDDSFYRGKSTDQSVNMDRAEINSWMEA